VQWLRQYFFQGGPIGGQLLLERLGHNRAIIMQPWGGGGKSFRQKTEDDPHSGRPSTSRNDDVIGNSVT